MVDALDSHYKYNMEWKCKYCNCICKSRRILFNHLKECTEREKMPKDSLGRVITNEQRNALKNAVHKSQIGRKLSIETKKKISEGRLKALQEGRGNHWICPHINRSYAEQYFYDAFINANLTFENNVWLCKRYCVDFLFDNKFYFEVDGEQHYTNDAIKHDKEREKFLYDNGYILLGRCRWKNFKKLSKEEKTQFINGLVAQLAEASHSKCEQCEFESHPVYYE